MNWWILGSATYVIGWVLSLREAVDAVTHRDNRPPKERTTERMWGAAGLALLWPPILLLVLGCGVTLGVGWLLKTAVPLTKAEKAYKEEQAKLELNEKEQETRKLAKEYGLPSTDLATVPPVVSGAVQYSYHPVRAEIIRNWDTQAYHYPDPVCKVFRKDNPAFKNYNDHEVMEIVRGTRPVPVGVKLRHPWSEVL
jgi:hypothetical protein